MMLDSGIDGIRAFVARSADGFASLHDAADALAQHLGQSQLPDPSRLADAMRRDTHGRWHWHWDPATGKSEFLHPPSEGKAVLDAAARTRSPLILVRAEHSHLVTDEGVASFKRLAPQLEVSVAKGAGHMFTADRNDQSGRPRHQTGAPIGPESTLQTRPPTDTAPASSAAVEWPSRVPSSRTVPPG